MIKAYNFLASWQLFPEKGNYNYGNRPKSGTYRIEADKEKKELTIHHNWVTLENQAFAAEYRIIADGEIHPLENEVMDSACVCFIDSIQFEINFFKDKQIILTVKHDILPNGYLQLTNTGLTAEGNSFTNLEVYHKQMSVLPYAAEKKSYTYDRPVRGQMVPETIAVKEEEAEKTNFLTIVGSKIGEVNGKALISLWTTYPDFKDGKIGGKEIPMNRNEFEKNGFYFKASKEFYEKIPAEEAEANESFNHLRKFKSFDK